MLGESHDLRHEFPNLNDKISVLCDSDQAFAHLMADHDSLDAQVRELEELGTPVTDETIEELKKRRLLMKDRLYAKLRGN